MLDFIFVHNPETAGGSLARSLDSGRFAGNIVRLRNEDFFGHDEVPRSVLGGCGKRNGGWGHFRYD